MKQYKLMERIEIKEKLKKAIQIWKSKKYKIGFVPTMGVLHEGHKELVRRSLLENDKTVCSIFVNPLQFNKKEDLDNYPNTLENDLELLRNVGCHIVFTPESDVFYDGVKINKYDFGVLGEVMEAQFRPGHFEGVATVVKELFLVVTPDNAYFGEKDFQQLAIIKWLVKLEKLLIQVVVCKTVRAESGLALSSRNLRLSEEGQLTASGVYDALIFCLNNTSIFDPQTLVEMAIAKLEQRFEVEYFEIVDEDSFERIEKWEESKYPRAFVVVHLEGVRLIDNMSLNP
ncbi:pantoate--beta-alanine ligase [Vicingaceae bacterium]|nr:pantoate--beta-alanine ligase [Vicingaceae bacterium]